MKKKLYFIFFYIFISIMHTRNTQPHEVELLFSYIGINTAIAEENNTFYVDPGIGSMKNTGAIDQPWSTLEDVVKSNLIQTKDKAGNVINKNGKVKAGDTIILRSGYHGHVQIKNAFNDKKIIIKPDVNAEARLSELELISAKNWSFSGLIISPTFSDTGIRTNSIVVLGENGYYGNSSNIDLTDSYIYSFSEKAEDISNTDWGAMAKNGITMGRNASNLNIQNNFVGKVAFGIVALSPQSIVSGNVITDFSYDGLRVNGADSIIEFNVIKNNYSVNANHADAIQGLNSNGIIAKHISIVNNVILNRDKKANPYPGGLQGIGFFDGPFYDINIQGNVVMALTWQGIALYNSVGGLIKNNVVYTPKNIELRYTGRITASGTYDKGIVMDNYVSYNFAHQYVFYKDDILSEMQNLDIDDQPQSSEEIFMDSLKNKLDMIYTKYGKTHITAKQERVTNDFITYGPSAISDQ